VGEKKKVSRKNETEREIIKRVSEAEAIPSSGNL